MPTISYYKSFTFAHDSPLAAARFGAVAFGQQADIYGSVFGYAQICYRKLHMSPERYRKLRAL